MDKRLQTCYSFQGFKLQSFFIDIDCLGTELNKTIVYAINE